MRALRAGAGAGAGRAAAASPHRNVGPRPPPAEPRASRRAREAGPPPERVGERSPGPVPRPGYISGDSAEPGAGRGTRRGFIGAAGQRGLVKAAVHLSLRLFSEKYNKEKNFVKSQLKGTILNF